MKQWHSRESSCALQFNIFSYFYLLLIHSFIDPYRNLPSILDINLKHLLMLFSVCFIVFFLYVRICSVLSMRTYSPSLPSLHKKAAPLKFIYKCSTSISESPWMIRTVVQKYVQKYRFLLQHFYFQKWVKGEREKFRREWNSHFLLFWSRIARIEKVVKDVRANWDKKENSMSHGAVKSQVEAHEKSNHVNESFENLVMLQKKKKKEKKRI